jgi:hypothetical protein
MTPNDQIEQVVKDVIAFLGIPIRDMQVVQHARYDDLDTQLHWSWWIFTDQRRIGGRIHIDRALLLEPTSELSTAQVVQARAMVAYVLAKELLHEPTIS